MSAVIAFRVPGTDRSIAVALGPELALRDQKKVIKRTKVLEARATDGRKLLTPFLRGWSRKKRTAAATVITAGIATGVTTAEIARAIRADSPKEITMFVSATKQITIRCDGRKFRGLVRKAVREAVALTKEEERIIEGAFLRLCQTKRRS